MKHSFKKYSYTDKRYKKITQIIGQEDTLYLKNTRAWYNGRGCIGIIAEKKRSKSVKISPGKIGIQFFLRHSSFSPCWPLCDLSVSAARICLSGMGIAYVESGFNKMLEIRRTLKHPPFIHGSAHETFRSTILTAEKIGILGQSLHFRIWKKQTSGPFFLIVFASSIIFRIILFTRWHSKPHLDRIQRDLTPTKHFTELQNPSVDEPYVAHKRRSADLKALKLWKDRSGQSTRMPPLSTRHGAGEFSILSDGGARLKSPDMRETQSGLKIIWDIAEL